MKTKSLKTKVLVWLTILSLVVFGEIALRSNKGMPNMVRTLPVVSKQVIASTAPPTPGTVPSVQSTINRSLPATSVRHRPASTAGSAIVTTASGTASQPQAVRSIPVTSSQPAIVTTASGTKVKQPVHQAPQNAAKKHTAPAIVTTSSGAKIKHPGNSSSAAKKHTAPAIVTTASGTKIKHPGNAPSAAKKHAAPAIVTTASGTVISQKGKHTHPVVTKASGSDDSHDD